MHIPQRTELVNVTNGNHLTKCYKKFKELDPLKQANWRKAGRQAGRQAGRDYISKKKIK